MANDERLGASFSIDVTALKAGLAQANRLIRESESEFKAAAAGMDDWTESQEGLEARMKHLNTSADLQRKKVDALQNEYDRLIADGLDPTSAAAVKLRTDINKEQEALNKTEKEIRKQAEALEELENAAEEAADATRETGDAAEDAGDGFTVGEGAIATFIGNGLLALVGACKDAITSVLGLADATKEFRTIMASLENSSKAAGYTVAETEATFKQLNGVLGDTQSAATTTANLQAIGLEQSKLQELTNGVIGAWARYGDSIPIDGLSEAINHTISLGSVQGNLADVIEWAGGNVDDFNAQLEGCTTEAERADLIQKMLAEQGLVESGKAWQENNKSIVDANNAQAEYDETMAELGEKIEPLTNKLTDLKAKGLQWLIDTGLPALQNGFTWVKDNIPTITTVLAGLTAATVAYKVAQLAATAAENGMTLAKYAATVAQNALNASMLANPISLIILAVTALVAAFIHLWKNCEGFRKFWIDLWEGLKKAVGAVVDWIKENWKTMLLFLVNPLAGIFKYCYEHFEGFRNFVDNIVKNVKQFFVDLWQGLKDGVVNAWTATKDTLSSIGGWIYDNIIAPVAKFFTDLWNGIVNAYHTVIDPWIEIFKRISVIAYDSVIKPITDAFANLWQKVKDGAQAAWNFVVGIYTTVANWFNANVIQPVAGFFSRLWDGFTESARKAWDGVKSIFSNVASFFGDIFQKAWQKVKDVFSVGGKIFDGIKDGIVTSFKKVVNAIIRGINKVVKVPFEGLNNILNKINGLEIVGVKPFEWLNWRAPIPNIPELATGGVVTQATHAIIGEDGAEAVMPLEKNTGWIKQLAKEIAAEQGNGVTVYQTNNYKQAYTSPIEKYKSKQQLYATARLIKAGAI